MEHIIKPMPPEMKEALKRKRLAEAIQNRIESNTLPPIKRTAPRNDKVVWLPEGITGHQFKKIR